MTVRDFFPASIMAMSGLFLSGFFEYFPLSSLLFLLLCGVLAGLFLVRGRISLLFLAASFILGICQHPLPSPPSPARKLSSPFSGCIRNLPEPSRNGSWVDIKNSGRDAGLPGSLRLHVPENRQSGGLFPKDCLSGTLTPVSTPSPPPSIFRKNTPTYEIAPWDTFRVVHSPSPLDRLMRSAARTGQILADHLRSTYPPDTSALLCALDLSNTMLITPETLGDFQRAGVSHLLSVSGEHMTLLALFLGGIVFCLVRILPLPLLRNLLVRTPLIPVLAASTLPVLAFYTVMIGMPSAAVRAFLGFLILSLLKIFFVDLEFRDILGLSTMIMLFAFPDLVHSLSFTLSVLALWGIVLFQKCHRPPDGAPSSGRHSLYGTLSESILAGLSITLLTAPLLASVFKTANPSGILSNSVIVPIAGDVLLPMGFLDLASFLVLDHPAPVLPLFVTSVSHIVLGLVHGFASLPGAIFGTPEPWPAGLFVFYLTVATILLLDGRRMPFPGVIVALGALFVLSLAMGKHSPPCPLNPALEPASPRQVHYLPRTERSNLAALFRCNAPDP